TRQSGHTNTPVQYVTQATWTHVIDPQTSKPSEYNPTLDYQPYAEGPDVNNDKRTRRVCPDTAGGNNYWPASYSEKTRLLYIPSIEGCSNVTPGYAAHVRGRDAGGTTVNSERPGSSSGVADPASTQGKTRR